MTKILKDFNDKMMSSINNLNAPNLEKLLSKYYATSAKQKPNICQYCEKTIPKSLSHHLRYCNAKKAFEDNSLKIDTS